MAKRSSIISNLNAWGYLLRKGLVDVDFVCRFNTPIWIIRFWKVNEPITLRSRELHNSGQNMDFEYLYDAVRKKYPNIDENSRRGQDIVIEKMKN
jgi:hypothetical protein